MSTNNSNKSYSTAATARSKGLFWETPLIYSAPLSSLCSRPVYLKLDCLQASGSFKDRGMAHLCQTLQDEQGVTKLVSSSGGNAGLAVATVGQKLGLQVSVVVPQTTKQLVIDKLKRLGADVTVHGENWNAADKYTRQLVEKDDHAAYISPYDNPLLWTGHSSLVEELKDQLASLSSGDDDDDDDVAPAAIIVSVGGGGLLCGVLEGIQSVGWNDTVVGAAETIGASSFGQAWQQQKIVRLEAIESIATSLGALEVTPVALERAKHHKNVHELLCTDSEAVYACDALAQDHRILVEPACGAALAALYSDRLRTSFLEKIPKDGPVVVEVCGGSGVSLDLLAEWKKEHLS